MATECNTHLSALTSTLDKGFVVSSPSLSGSQLHQEGTLALNCESQLCPKEESKGCDPQRERTPAGDASNSQKVQLSQTNPLTPAAPNIDSLPVFNPDPLHWLGSSCDSGVPFVCVSPPRSPLVPPFAGLLSAEAQGHHQPSPLASSSFTVDLLDNLCSTPLSGLKNLQVHWHKPTEISAIAHQSVEEATDHLGVLKIASVLEDTSSDTQPELVEPALEARTKGLNAIKENAEA